MARVGRGSKCCGSDPRCRTCPVRLAAELRAIEDPTAGLPEHLVGLPPCLHKYEPLFRAPTCDAHPLPAAAQPA